MSAEVARKTSQLPSARCFDSHARTNAMPYLTQQYALPIRRDSADAPPADGRDQTPRAENTLRRKTPNGTLNAGYDATVEERHPQKHQLLVDERPPPLAPYAAPTASAKHTFLEHQLRQQGTAGGWSSTPTPTPTGFGWPGSQYAQPHSMPVMDSMLHQMPVHHHLTPHPYYGQTVPSVVQPPYQHLGPTASGGPGSGLYGPYWHDGTYIPYRPTAVRDPRFRPHPPAHWHGSLPGSSQFAPPAHLWNPPPAPSQGSPWSVGPGFGSPASHLAPPFGPFPSTYAPVPDPDASTPYGSTAAAPPVTGSLWDEQGLIPSDGDAEVGPHSPGRQQRDTTFAWALQQYKELLAYIHHNRRQQQQQHQQQHGKHLHRPPLHRPAIYPKPPKPSTARSSLQFAKRRAASDGNASKEKEAAALSRCETAPNGKDGSGGGGLHDDPGRAKARSDSIWGPMEHHSHDPGHPRRPSQDHWPRSQHPHPPLLQSMPHAPDRPPRARHSSGPIVAPVSSPHLIEGGSPQSRAHVALSCLAGLCQDTDWQWTDGMHLGGCLAYGLGYYQQAQKWYTRVLETEPDHLEAISNLAATMLALGRRQDAEQHWVKVVKAAPNYFEAVEHLVGLLCNDRRTPDAIRVIEHVERSLRYPTGSDGPKPSDKQSECSSTASRSPCSSELSDKISYDFDADGDGYMPDWRDSPAVSEPGFGSSGFAIPGSDNGRILALIHAKGNMLYALGENGGAARAFEDAVLIAVGRRFNGIQALIQHILTVVSFNIQLRLPYQQGRPVLAADPILLSPDQALATAKVCFPQFGDLPGLQHVAGGPHSLARRAVISTTSNSLLSLAKIFQDGMSNSARSAGVAPLDHGVRDILALYYLSLSLQPSPSTANNVGILLASVQQAATPIPSHQKSEIPGVVPGSGIALALQYYNYGLQLDRGHAHLHTNLGSLLKDIGQLDAAIQMYEQAVKCDPKFDIALANLANAVKDKGRVGDAISFYKRAVEVNADFAEAMCGLANALNSVCGWQARGGIAEDGGKRDAWHVDANGMLVDARQPGVTSSGWIKRVVDIVEKQLVDGESWGRGTLTPLVLEALVQQVTLYDRSAEDVKEREAKLRKALTSWAGQKWEGMRVTRLVERATRRIGWHWYRDVYVKKRFRAPSSYNRPQLPPSLSIPAAPTVLPFHTFTCPMSAKQIRLISQRNGLRISASALRSPWLPLQVYPPPSPPAPYLRVGYVSSDFNNHPLAHLMQSVFGMHDVTRVKAFCYATTGSDNSPHRKQIEAEAPVFYDASSWSAERLVNQIVLDGIHILVNLNGYTRGARNEVFAARPAPIQMSFMGFAGTLGAEWCDYLLADETAVPPSTLRPWRRNVDVEDQIVDENEGGDHNDWVYGENIIYCRDTFFCCDHRQSAPDAQQKRADWDEERRERWQMRQELFPQLSDDTIIFSNFNQLYKIEPTTFRTWLRILAKVPNSILWLLRFPDLGEPHLLATARLWAGEDVARRVIFTDVAPKHLHISRARICDLVLDTPECNAHTTAADVLWSGTPLLTLPRYPYKMCSRMAASILKGALPKDAEGAHAAEELIATSEKDYEEKALRLAKSLVYTPQCQGRGTGRLMDLREMLYRSRWTSALFDTKRWVRDLEDAYDVAWSRYVHGEGGDIWLDQVPRQGQASASGSA